MSRSKTVTDKQLAANRRNAQSSTGPRTPEGRARSRWNALKHGALSRAIVPAPLAGYESLYDFSRLHDALRLELAPGSALEEILVESIAASYWRLARVHRAEAGAIAIRQAGAPKLASYLARDWPSPFGCAGPQEQAAQIKAETLAAERLVSSIPSIDHALQLARYEAHIQRQLFRALAALEHLQQQRLGQPDPPLGAGAQDSSVDEQAAP